MVFDTLRTMLLSEQDLIHFGTRECEKLRTVGCKRSSIEVIVELDLKEYLSDCTLRISSKI